jgi:hypothetical protein
MTKHLFGLGAMLVGTGMMFVLLTCAETNAQMKTMEQISEERRQANELINQEIKREFAEQRLEEEKRRATEQKLKDEKQRVAEQKALGEEIRRERVKREQAGQKAEKKRLNEKKVAEFIKNNDAPSSCICNPETTIVFKSQLVKMLKPMHCYCGNLDCIVGDNHSSCVKRSK